MPRTLGGGLGPGGTRGLKLVVGVTVHIRSGGGEGRHAVGHQKSQENFREKVGGKFHPPKDVVLVNQSQDGTHDAGDFHSAAHRFASEPMVQKPPKRTALAQSGLRSTCLLEGDVRYRVHLTITTGCLAP